MKKEHIFPCSALISGVFLEDSPFRLIENLILIELQKTWLTTETLRFRQYLGMQYLNKENMIAEKEANKERTTFGLPIVSIYILEHCLSDLKEPVIYVRRHYLDYDDKALPAAAPEVRRAMEMEDEILSEIEAIAKQLSMSIEQAQLLVGNAGE